MIAKWKTKDEKDNYTIVNPWSCTRKIINLLAIAIITVDMVRVNFA